MRIYIFVCRHACVDLCVLMGGTGSRHRGIRNPEGGGKSSEWLHDPHRNRSIPRFRDFGDSGKLTWHAEVALPHVCQVAELSDEGNWRSGLRVRLLGGRPNVRIRVWGLGFMGERERGGSWQGAFRNQGFFFSHQNRVFRDSIQGS